MKHLMNAMAAQALRAQGGFSGTRQGLITGYDPDTYSIKVTIMPEQMETGWIPLATPWAGNGWGFAAGPVEGAQIEVNFDSGAIGDGLAGGQFFNDTDRCPGPPSGELWLVHQSGSLLKFHNDGSVELTATASITYTATEHTFHGPVTMDKTLQVTQQITGQGGMAVSGGSGAAMQVIGDMTSSGTITGATDVVGGGKSLKTHTHNDPQGGTTSAPN
jgi:phage baseplate assembly protein V